MENTDLSRPFDSVAVQRFIAASAERLWGIISSEAGMQSWLGLCVFQPRMGGRVLLDTSGSNEADRIIVFGRVSAFDELQRVSFTWAQMRSDRSVWPADTEVEISLEAAEGGTLARLRHSGFDRLSTEHAKRAYSVYHHCWVQSGCMPLLSGLAGEA